MDFKKIKGKKMKKFKVIVRTDLICEYEFEAETREEVEEMTEDSLEDGRFIREYPDPYSEHGFRDTPHEILEIEEKK